ncbi:hypothetical protein HQ520_13660 [bacterium]|nr:hypothetical protein [bacterium]
MQPVRWTARDAWFCVPRQVDHLDMSLCAPHPDAQEEPVVVEVFVDGSLARTLLFTHPWEAHSLNLGLPPGLEKEIEVRLRVSRTMSPARLSPRDLDTRELGVLVEGWGFRVQQSGE